MLNSGAMVSNRTALVDAWEPWSEHGSHACCGSSTFDGASGTRVCGISASWASRGASRGGSHTQVTAAEAGPGAWGHVHEDVMHDGPHSHLRHHEDAPCIPFLASVSTGSQRFPEGHVRKTLLYIPERNCSKCFCAFAFEQDSTLILFTQFTAYVTLRIRGSFHTE